MDARIDFCLTLHSPTEATAAWDEVECTRATDDPQRDLLRRDAAELHWTSRERHSARGRAGHPSEGGDGGAVEPRRAQGREAALRARVDVLAARVEDLRRVVFDGTKTQTRWLSQSVLRVIARSHGWFNDAVAHRNTLNLIT